MIGVELLSSLANLIVLSIDASSSIASLPVGDRRRPPRVFLNDHS